MPRFFLRSPCLAILLMGSLFALSANAATVGFDGSMGGAALGFTNTSTTAKITRVHITIGDTAYNFDDVGLLAGLGPTLLSPDAVNDGVRADYTEMTFTSFDPGDSLNLPWDIDPDSGNSGCCRVSGVLFNNGAAPNAVLTVDFDTGDQIVFALLDTQASADDPDTGAACPSSLSCAFGQSLSVPEPRAIQFLSCAGGAFALATLPQWRRRNSFR